MAACSVYLGLRSIRLGFLLRIEQPLYQNVATGYSLYVPLFLTTNIYEHLLINPEMPFETQGLAGMREW